MREFEITTGPRGAAFLAQIGHESMGLARVVEDLRYRPERLARMFPARCADSHGQPNHAAIEACRRGEEAIAELIYGQRTDLGNFDLGDGHRYRGRGFLQVTGKAN